MPNLALTLSPQSRIPVGYIIAGDFSFPVKGQGDYQGYSLICWVVNQQSNCRLSGTGTFAEDSNGFNASNHFILYPRKTNFMWIKCGSSKTTILITNGMRTIRSIYFGANALNAPWCESLRANNLPVSLAEYTMTGKNTSTFNIAYWPLNLQKLSLADNVVLTNDYMGGFSISNLVNSINLVGGRAPTGWTALDTTTLLGFLSTLTWSGINRSINFNAYIPGPDEDGLSIVEYLQNEKGVICTFGDGEEGEGGFGM